MQHCLALSRKSLAISGVRDGYRNRKNPKNFCALSAQVSRYLVQAAPGPALADQPRPQSDFEPLLIRFWAGFEANRIKSGSKSDQGPGPGWTTYLDSWALFEVIIVRRRSDVGETSPTNKDCIMNFLPGSSPDFLMFPSLGECETPAFTCYKATLPAQCKDVHWQ